MLFRSWALAVRIGSRNIAECVALRPAELRGFLKSVPFGPREGKIAQVVCKELEERLTALPNLDLRWLHSTSTTSDGDRDGTMLFTDLGRALADVPPDRLAGAGGEVHRPPDDLVGLPGIDAEAHRLQHAISSAFEDRMDELCGYPTHCPHGDPIPRKDGAMPDEPLTPLTDLQPGQEAVLRRIGNTDARVLRYLSQLKLEPGRIVTFIEAAPFNGPVTIEVHGMNGDEERVRQVLGSELAAQLFVLVKQPTESVQWEVVRDGAQTI